MTEQRGQAEVCIYCGVKRRIKPGTKTVHEYFIPWRIFGPEWDSLRPPCKRHLYRYGASHSFKQRGKP